METYRTISEEHYQELLAFKELVLDKDKTYVIREIFFGYGHNNRYVKEPLTQAIALMSHKVEVYQRQIDELQNAIDNKKWWQSASRIVKNFKWARWE
jgi:hypothetical protein